MTRWTDTSFTKSAAFKPPRKPRGAGGRQHVIRSDRVIAGHLRRPGADEHRAGIHDAPRDRFGSGDDVFGGGVVGERDRLVHARGRR